MGKPTGFLEYERKNAKVEEPLSRIRHFGEFRAMLSREEQSIQGARCMECGRPVLPVRNDDWRDGIGMPAAQSCAGDKRSCVPRKLGKGI